MRLYCRRFVAAHPSLILQTCLAILDLQSGRHHIIRELSTSTSARMANFIGTRAFPCPSTRRSMLGFYFLLIDQIFGRFG